MVSPTFTSVAVLIPEIIYPTSPAATKSRGFKSIPNTPTSSAKYSFPVLMNLTLSPLRSTPFLIRKYAIIPRNELNTESKTIACNGASMSPTGAGMRAQIASKIAGTPSPVFPLAAKISSRSHPIKSTI